MGGIDRSGRVKKEVVQELGGDGGGGAGGDVEGGEEDRFR